MYGNEDGDPRGQLDPRVWPSDENKDIADGGVSMPIGLVILGLLPDQDVWHDRVGLTNESEDGAWRRAARALPAPRANSCSE